MGLLVKGHRVGWQSRNPQGKWPPGPLMCEALLDQAPKPKPSAPSPVPCSRPERNTEPLARLCLAGAQCGHHLAFGETQCRAPEKHGEAGRLRDLLLLDEASAEPARWSSPPRSPFRTARQALLGTISAEAISCGHSVLTDPSSPVTPGRSPVPTPSRILPLAPPPPGTMLRGWGSRHHPLFTTVIRGLLVTHLTVIVVIVSLLLFIIFIMAITKLFSLPAFFEFLLSVLTVTLLNGYYYDPHLGV